MSEEKAEYALKAKHVQELIAEAYEEGMTKQNNNLQTQLLELPERIQMQSLELAELTDHIEALRLSIELSKNQALELVLSATEEGKPKYSNDKARNLAVQQLLREDGLYLDNIDELGRKECELRKEQIQLDYLHNSFNAFRAIAGMQGVK